MLTAAGDARSLLDDDYFSTLTEFRNLIYILERLVCAPLMIKRINSIGLFMIITLNK